MTGYGALGGAFWGFLFGLIFFVPFLGAAAGAGAGASRHWGDIARHPENEQVPRVVVLRVESGLFFANADYVREAIRSHADEGDVHAVVLDAQTVPFVDVTAAEMLTQLRDELASQGVTLLLARDVGQVRDVLRQSDTTDDAGSRRVFATVEEAVEAATTLRSGNTSQTNTQETP